MGICTIFNLCGGMFILGRDENKIKRINREKYSYDWEITRHCCTMKHYIYIFIYHY